MLIVLVFFKFSGFAKALLFDGSLVNLDFVAQGKGAQIVQSHDSHTSWGPSKILVETHLYMVFFDTVLPSFIDF